MPTMKLLAWRMEKTFSILQGMFFIPAPAKAKHNNDRILHSNEFNQIKFSLHDFIVSWGSHNWANSFCPGENGQSLMKNSAQL